MANDVTIGIPLYRAEKYIKDCLNSALSQSYPNIDYLVLDDACDDSSVEIVSQMQKEHPRGESIRLIRHTQNVGIGETRNHLIAETKTKYFFFLDADDVITDNAIQLLHDAAEEYQADLVYGSHEQIDMTIESHPVSSMIYKQQHFLQPEEYPTYDNYEAPALGGTSLLEDYSDDDDNKNKKSSDTITLPFERDKEV